MHAWIWIHGSVYICVRMIYYYFSKSWIKIPLIWYVPMFDTTTKSISNSLLSLLSKLNFSNFNQNLSSNRLALLALAKFGQPKRPSHSWAPRTCTTPTYPLLHRSRFPLPPDPARASLRRCRPCAPSLRRRPLGQGRPSAVVFCCQDAVDHRRCLLPPAPPLCATPPSSSSATRAAPPPSSFHFCCRSRH